MMAAVPPWWKTTQQIHLKKKWYLSPASRDFIHCSFCSTHSKSAADLHCEENKDKTWKTTSGRVLQISSSQSCALLRAGSVFRRFTCHKAALVPVAAFRYLLILLQVGEQGQEVHLNIWPKLTGTWQQFLVWAYLTDQLSLQCFFLDSPICPKILTRPAAGWQWFLGTWFLT